MVVLKMIVAMTRNGGIGYKGNIPWYHSQDLKRFRRLTSGSSIIMGRKTWDSLPKKPLPNRTNIILTRSVDNVQHTNNQCIVVQTPEEAIQSINTNAAWIIGGQAVYETFIHHPLLQTIDCTIVPENPECDTFFVPIPERFNLITITNKPLNDTTDLIHHEYSRSSSQSEILDGSPSHDS
jgi:dihydrofolate reductase